jgi:hypothetical protein
LSIPKASCPLQSLLLWLQILVVAWVTVTAVILDVEVQVGVVFGVEENQ